MMRVATKWIALGAVACGVGLGIWWSIDPAAVEAPPVLKFPESPPTEFPEIAPAKPIDRRRSAIEGCDEARFGEAARSNALSVGSMSWAPFRRPEKGWETYAVRIAAEIGTACPPSSEGFASALAEWQQARGLRASGVLDAATFQFMKGVWQEQRPFVLASGRGVCPDPPPASELENGRAGEGYGGKQVQLHRDAFAAYRRMAAAARAEDPAIAADPRYLQIFSAYRSPEYDAARCARDQNCNGIVRARCSAHRTGMAADLYVGQAPGYGPDSSADPNRLHMTRTPAYRWLVANAHRFGFVNYTFEPWHWEWIGGQG